MENQFQVGNNSSLKVFSLPAESSTPLPYPSEPSCFKNAPTRALNNQNPQKDYTHSNSHSLLRPVRVTQQFPFLYGQRDQKTIHRR